MGLETLIVTLVIGGLVGWLASVAMKTNAQMSILANIIVGIVGSALGAWLFSVLGIVVLGALGRWIMAVAGAMVLIGVLKALKVYK
jgi:uncharacterized membrane protein YeaQ/YmgE (transglycosylase-associated protein family)